jgi:hypothetical protein
MGVINSPPFWKEENMGVSVSSKNLSNNFTLSGFKKIKEYIVELTNNYKFIKLYDQINGIEEWSPVQFSEYDQELNDIIKNSGKGFAHIVEFVYQPDDDGSLAKTKCKTIWDMIKNNDSVNDKVFECEENEGFATFNDFKNIILDGSENNGIKWN